MTISTINWTIISAKGGLDIVSGHDRIGVIQTDGKRWTVHFVHRDELDFEWSSLDVCVGYVRGIERVSVNKAHSVKFTGVYAVPIEARCGDDHSRHF